VEDAAQYRFEAVTAERGADLEAFSRANGRFGYCSCMRWRLPSGQYRAAGRDGRAAASIPPPATTARRATLHPFLDCSVQYRGYHGPHAG